MSVTVESSIAGVISKACAGSDSWLLLIGLNGSNIVLTVDASVDAVRVREQITASQNNVGHWLVVLRASATVEAVDALLNMVRGLTPDVSVSRWLVDGDGKVEVYSGPHQLQAAPTLSSASSRPAGLAGLLMPRDESVFGSSVVAGLDRPRVVVVANPKGGSGKTPTSVLLAAGFGHSLGVKVALVDNNPAGNLRSRLEFCPPDAATLDDLVDLGDQLTPQIASSAVVWQSNGRFAGVPARSRKLVTGKDGSQQLDRPTLAKDEIVRVLGALRSSFKVIVLDSGNSDADDPWRAAVSMADSLVVPLRWEKDYCEAAWRLVETLAVTGFDDLVSKCVIVESGPSRPVLGRRSRYSKWFADNGLRIMRLPSDKHISVNSGINWSRLKPVTRKSVTGLCQAVSSSWR